MYQVFSQEDTVVFRDPVPGPVPSPAEGRQDTLPQADTARLDSALAPAAERPVQVPSMLKDHNLRGSKLEHMPRPFGNEDWITAHFLFALVVFAWIRLFYFKRLRQTLRAFLGYRYQAMLVREGNVLRERISIALMIVYLISTSLLVYLFFTRILDYYMLQLTSFRLFSFIMLAVIVLWILKNVANTVIGRVYQNPVVISDYILTNFVFNVTVGTILMPILILAVYLPSVDMVYIGLGVWVISFIYRLIRLLFTSLSFTKFSLFNRILYLCTFEIAPVFILIKLVMSNIG